MKHPTISIPESAWEPIGDPPRLSDRLLATIEINGRFFHAEAIAVEERDGVQEAAAREWRSHFDELYEANGGDGAAYTVPIAGRDYAVFVSPFCR